MILLIPFLLCWGSFLNVLGYRLIIGQNIVTKRSHCLSCSTTLSWYHLIPVLSWLALRGKCGFCKAPISWLYPFIELLTALSIYPLFNIYPLYFALSYAFFFSALIVTIRSDLETMLISRYVSLFLIPVGLLLSLCGLLPLTFTESLLGSFFGFSILWLVATVFYKLTKKQGMGQGDIELLAFIGAFVGSAGCWLTLLMSSMVGAILGSAYLLITGQKKSVRLPFGPFLAGGAMITVLYYNTLIAKLLSL